MNPDNKIVNGAENAYDLVAEQERFRTYVDITKAYSEQIVSNLVFYREVTTHHVLCLHDVHPNVAPNEAVSTLYFLKKSEEEEKDLSFFVLADGTILTHDPSMLHSRKDGKEVTNPQELYTYNELLQEAIDQAEKEADAAQ